MANASVTKFLSKTLSTFKIIPATPDTVTMDKNRIHITLSIVKVPLFHNGPQGNDETDRDSDTQNENNFWNENKTDQNFASIIRELLAQIRVEHVKIRRRRK